MLSTLLLSALLGCQHTVEEPPGDDRVGHDVDTGESPESLWFFPGNAEVRDNDLFKKLDEESTYQRFYDPHVIQEVHVELTPDAIATLDKDGRVYVSGNVVINGQRFDNVGIRRKGSSTYQTFSQKPSLKIKLNAFVPGQKYGGLERLTLNNMVSDASQSKEVIVYHVWEQAGLHAPKANYAKVWINDELYGLYANLESMDDHWAKRRYADGTGDLWGTAPEDAEFSDGGIANWVLKAGEGDTTKLQAVADALASASGDFRADMDPYVNVDEFLTYWAWCIMMGNQDGYPYHLNDVFIYSDPGNGGRFDFSPWGVDESYDDMMKWNRLGGELGLACIRESACVSELQAAVQQAEDTYLALDIPTFANEMWTLTHDPIQEDPRRPWTTLEVDDARALLAGEIAARPDAIRTQMGL